MESNAVILHNFWRPQPIKDRTRETAEIEPTNHPTLLWAPIFHQQEDQDNGFTFFNAGGAESSLRKQAWRNPKEGRVGCLHQVTDIAFTSDFCNNYSHPASPASLYLTSPRSRPTRPRVPYLMSSSPSSRVPKSQVPTHASRCPRPLVPVPLLYTAVVSSHKSDGVGVGRIRTFPFSSDSAYDSVAYDQVKTRLSESEAEAEG